MENYTAGDGPATPSLNELLTTRQAAEAAGHTVKTLNQYRAWRISGRYPEAGPDFAKLGRAVFYTRSAIDAYVANRQG
ncbi:MAG: helix-turn-helix domain-containing protein [Myxococcota bacterium]